MQELHVFFSTHKCATFVNKTTVFENTTLFYHAFSSTCQIYFYFTFYLSVGIRICVYYVPKSIYVKSINAYFVYS